MKGQNSQWMVRVRLAQVLPIIFGLFSVNTFAAHVDPVPIPGDIIEKLVRPHTSVAAHPLAVKLEQQLDAIQQALNDLQRAGLDNSAHATQLQLLEAADVELEGDHTQWDEHAKELRKQIQQRGGYQHTREWDELQVKVTERFGRLKHALRAVREAKNDSARTAALTQAQSVLRDIYGKRRDAQSGFGSEPISTWTQRDPGPPREEPESAHVPAYITANDADAKAMYAALDGVQLAVVPSTPAEAATCSYSAADLAADGQEIQLTTEIRDLAATLEYSPARIFEYVNNEIAFEPYFGSLKGAVGTLYAKAGGATDQASLLIALLRASNIPARYVRGTIDVLDASSLDAEGRAPKWLGTKSYIAAEKVLAQGRNPTAVAVTNGVRLSHVWVEACIPYSHYRGARATNAGHRWVPLDASFKSKTYQQGIVTNVNFDYTSYLATRSNTLPDEAYNTQIATAIKSLPPRYAELRRQYARRCALRWSHCSAQA